MKKVGLIILSIVVSLCICGCGGNKVEKEIVNNVFTYVVDNNIYINDSYTFYKDGKCKRVYKAGLDGEAYKTTNIEYVYNIEDNTVTLSNDEEKITFEYDAEEKCLVNGSKKCCK